MLPLRIPISCFDIRSLDSLAKHVSNSFKMDDIASIIIDEAGPSKSDGLYSSRRRSRLSHATPDPSGEQSGDEHSATVPNDYESTSTFLLFIFRLLHARKVPSLKISRLENVITDFAMPHEFFMNFTPDIRRRLGEGGSYSVEEAYLPIRDAFIDQFPRNGSQGRQHFVDHTGAAWSRNTVAAYKKSSVTVADAVMDDGPKRRRLDDALTELQVLCHRPLWRHPNIVRLLGVAWLADEGLPDPEHPDRLMTQSSLELPTLLKSQS